MAKTRARGRKPRPHSQAARVLLLLEELRGRRAPTRLSALAEKLGVSERQVRRDAKAIEEAGHDLITEPLEGRAAMRLARPGGDAITPSQRERFSLLVVQRVFGVLEGTPFAADVKAITGRLFKSTDPKELAAWGRRITYVADGGVKPYNDEGTSDPLDVLLTGLIHKTRVQVTYQTAKRGRKEGAFEPWGVALYRHGLYFVGHFPGGEHLYVLPLERFRSAERLRKEHFTVPDDFDVAKVFTDCLGVVIGGEPIDVVLELAAEVAHLLDVRRFHHSQRTVVQADGTVRLTMRVAETPDLLSSILAWGERVRVIAPQALRERVTRTLEAALQQSRRDA